SNKFTRENRLEVVGRNVEAVRRAFTDTGRDVPDAYRERTLGILDVESDTKKRSKAKKAKKNASKKKLTSAGSKPHVLYKTSSE
ncbi:MAG: hypothetical protein MKZ89_15620, partial [Nisaea sp.]|nr:hypothetical protein [Nisaea sp.]